MTAPCERCGGPAEYIIGFYQSCKRCDSGAVPAAPLSFDDTGPFDWVMPSDRWYKCLVCNVQQLHDSVDVAAGARCLACNGMLWVMP